MKIEHLTQSNLSFYGFFDYRYGTFENGAHPIFKKVIEKKVSSEKVSKKKFQFKLFRLRKNAVNFNFIVY